MYLQWLMESLINFLHHKLDGIVSNFFCPFVFCRLQKTTEYYTISVKKYKRGGASSYSWVGQQGARGTFNVSNLILSGVKVKLD